MIFFDKIKEKFNLDKVDSCREFIETPIPMTFWKSGNSYGFIFEFKNNYYGAAIIADKNCNDLDMYLTFRQNAIETYNDLRDK